MAKAKKKAKSKKKPKVKTTKSVGIVSRRFVFRVAVTTLHSLTKPDALRMVRSALGTMPNDGSITKIKAQLVDFQ